MASETFLARATAIAATISVAAFAGCQPSPTGPSTLSSAPAAITPITPIMSVAPAPVADDPTTDPAAPGSNPSATPTPSVSATPTPSAVPAAADTATNVTLSGFVYDDLGLKLEAVTVTAKVLGGGTFSNGADTQAVTTQQGYYTLAGSPVGSTVQVTATKTGYTTRQQTYVPVVNPQKDTSLNSIGFGDPNRDPNLLFALTTRPEIVSFTPAAGATGIDPNTTFSLTFSTAVTPADVESNIAIYVSGSAGQTRALSTPDVTLTNRYDGTKDIGGPGNGVSAVIPDTAKFIYDFTSMTSAWSNGNKTVIFTFRPGVALPSDKDSAKVPQYAVSFKGGAIRDANGNNGRTDAWFRANPAVSGRVGFSFTVAADTTAPKLLSLTPSNKADDAGQNGGNPDLMLAKFSKPMALYLNDQGGLPIPRTAVGSGSVLLNTLIKYFVSTPGVATLPNGTNSLAGGFAFDGLNSATTGFLPLAQNAFASSDPTRATVQFVPLSDSVNGSGAAWAADQAVTGSNASTITVQNGVTNLNLGDFLQDSTVDPTGASASYRVTAINAGTKALTVTQYGGGAAPANNDVIRYWTTTTSASASNGTTNISLTGLNGLQQGDTLRVALQFGGTQTVTLTAAPGAHSVTFTPALTSTVVSGAAVSYVSPPSTIHTGYASGNTVWVGISPNVTDPAGNAVDTSGNGNFKSGVAQ